MITFSLFSDIEESFIKILSISDDSVEEITKGVLFEISFVVDSFTVLYFCGVVWYPGDIIRLVGLPSI
jgi:hypothetical protein